MIRYIAVFFFISQTIKHSQHQGDQKDVFTLLTFLFLSISELCLTTTRVITLLTTHNSCVGFGFTLTDVQKEYLVYILALLRPCLGYHFQTLSFLVNIHRWETIFRSNNNSIIGTGGRMSKRFTLTFNKKKMEESG